MNWDAIWQYVIGGAIVSWPGVAVGFWLAVRKTRAHVDARTEQQNELIEQRTEQQNELIAQLTEQQTAELLKARRFRPPGGYYGHGDASS